MRYPGLTIVLFLFPAILFAQEPQSDTIPFSDTITLETFLLKNAADFSYETVVDSAYTLVINELLAGNSELFFDNAGDDDDWFEIYNYGDDPVQLNNLFFTDDPAVPLKWKLDTIVTLELAQQNHFLIWADDEPEEGFNHASFKLSGEGEYLAIFTEDGTLVDQCYFGSQTTNISYGRYPDAGLTWNFFSDPTPGESNAEPGEYNMLPLPVSNLRGGLFTEPVILALHSSVAGASIFYTTDCTEPGNSDLLYQEPVEISTTTIIKARLIKEDAMNGPVLTISILMDDTDYENPVVSLVAEPDALYGSSGIISQMNSEIEVSASMEYMEGGETIYTGGAGVQLHSPKHIQPYSLDLYARSRYGNGWFDYPFFMDRGQDQFKRLILRNSGNDNINLHPTNTHFRDALIQTMGEKSNRHPMISQSKPVNVFLNGNYHGLFNLREREDRYYIESHTGVTEDYDFIELEFGYNANLHIIEGSYDSWLELLTFVDTTGDLSIEADFNIVKELVDLENFTDYWITEVFAGNYDWLSNNVKYWKPENGKWQWLYWDTDHGLGLKYREFGEVAWNTLYWSLTFSDRAWSNGYHNILIRNLLRNEGYKDYFIKRFTQLLSTSFSFDRTLPMLDSMMNLYQNDLMIHTRHWGSSMSSWEDACQIVEAYLQRRPDAVLIHLQEFFGLQDPVPLSLRVEPPGAGTISFSGLEISSIPVNGKFFPGMSYQLQYDSIPGFTFEKWDPFRNNDHSFEFQLTDSMEIVAYFLPSDGAFPLQLCEVYSNNRKNFDAGDWIEFYYYGSDSLDLNGWYITGDENELLYTFPEKTLLKPGQRFIVTEDLERFREIFPASEYCFGNMNHGFTNRSTLSLKSSEGETIKEVELTASEDWPSLPEEGYSFELKHLVDDTGNGSHWETSETIFGSPGLPNYTSYDFQAPSGKDSIFASYKTHILGFASSQDFYSDPDHHRLAAITIYEITGPGLFYLEDAQVIPGGIYNPSDLIYHPQEPFNSSTKLVYSFTDISGQESSRNTLWFNPAVTAAQGTREEFQLYPVPASEFCIVEFPSGVTGPLHFFLYDLNGKMIQSQYLSSLQGKMIVPLNGIENGIYFYRIETSHSVVNGKILVVK